MLSESIEIHKRNPIIDPVGKDCTMKSILRRDFLKTWGIGALALSPPALRLPVPLTQTETPQPTTNSNQGRNRTTVAEDVASWVAKLKYEELPPEVVTRAKRVLLDTIGCGLGAIHAGPVRIAQQVVFMQGGNPQATVVGIGRKASCEQAAFLNGMAIRYLDYNDYVAFGGPHHASMNVAPALAVAEMQGLSGKDLLLGITVGYEVEVRLRDASEKGSRAGWDYGSILEQYSSAAVAAKLLGMEAAGIAHAIAIAGSNANTLSEVRSGALASGGEMTPSKGTAEPLAVRNGTFAALLAKAGLTYPLTMLEGQSGFGKVVTGVLREDFLRRRSGDFQILKSCIKLWPCVGTAQGPIAAALEIYRQKPSPDEIETITVALGDFSFKNQQEFQGEINAREHADHSVPYTVARALLDGAVKVDDFEEKRYKDPRALELIQKVKLRSEPSLTTPGQDALGANIEVRLRNGRVLKAEMPYPPGSVQNPADEESITKKFLALSESVLGKDRSHKAIETILSVETKTNLKDLVDVVSAAKPA